MNYCVLSSVILFASVTSLTAQEFDSFFKNAGFRYGMDMESEVNLRSYEAFFGIDTPWVGYPSENITLDVDLEASAGVIAGEGVTAAFFRIAPTAEFTFGDFPISLVASSGPSFYSDDTFGDFDIGGSLQFTSSIGFNWHVRENWTVSYLWQHTSNANIEDPNPGFNMHALSVSYQF